MGRGQTSGSSDSQSESSSLLDSISNFLDNQALADGSIMISENDTSNGSLSESVVPTDDMNRQPSYVSQEHSTSVDGQQPKASIPPSEHRYEKKRPNLVARVFRRFLGTDLTTRNEDELIVPFRPTENSPLLSSIVGQTIPANANVVSEDTVEWGDIAASGNVRAAWPQEAKAIALYTAPLVVTFILQYSVDVSSIIAAGRIGKIELGAVSFANMSAAITCYTIFQGLATSLDTLCAQAYGSGHRHLVGLYCQRMTLFLLCLSIPVSILWTFSEHIIIHVVTDADTARLASSYLKILIFSIPGVIVFESGKRFLQAQGLFRVTTYVLFVAAPFHIVLIWLLVSKLGFIGAPISVAITKTLLPILLVLYVRFFDGSQCWGGLSKRAFANWRIMIRLAIPDMIMVEAEWFAFEILTVAASRFGTDYLAAQSVLTAVATITYQVPFPMSIAASTRVGNLIGAGMVDAARVAAKVAVVASCVTSCLIVIITITLRAQLPIIFTNDPEVAALAAQVLPFLGVTIFFDGISVAAHGLLRGIGKQAIGGPANLFAHYVISIPTSMALGFGFGLKLQGLYIGLATGLLVASLIEYIYLYKTDWRKAAIEAATRNAAG